MASNNVPELRERLQEALSPRYTIEREIGRGGMAVVYLATDVKHDRQVALKVLHPDIGAAVGTDRFLREIATTARLHHPHILSVHDSGDVAGLVFYTMPFVDGESLRERLTREGELPAGAVMRILHDVLEALAYAHDLGIVHRDIKPENIMLWGRHAALTDFGISKLLSGTMTAQALTSTGVAIGTPAYMAPEQSTAEVEVDHRADLYAVGIVGYELLTGHPPFRGTSQQVFAAHATKAPAPLQSVRGGVPRALADVVMRCLEKRPAERWQHAGDLLLRLEALEVDLDSWSVRGTGPPEDLTLTERTFRLSEAVCRKLDRAAVDPRMIGDAMTYLDNNVESDVLVCYLHGTGLDQRDFATVLRHSAHRSIAPTLYGCEPEARHRITLSLQAHAVLARELLADVVARLRPAFTVLVGFSSGGDFVLQMVNGEPSDRPVADGVISLDCNLSLETCFVTSVLAQMTLEEPEKLLGQLRTVGGQTGSIAEWVNVHDYLVKILRKFHGDIGPLRQFAADIVRPFTDPGRSPFVEWFTTASLRTKVLSCVFSESDPHTAVLNALKLANLDRGVLGARYEPECLATESGKGHFDLMEPSLIRRHVDDVVTRLRSRSDDTRVMSG